MYQESRSLMWFLKPGTLLPQRSTTSGKGTEFCQSVQPASAQRSPPSWLSHKIYLFLSDPQGDSLGSSIPNKPFFLPMEWSGPALSRSFHLCFLVTYWIWSHLGQLIKPRLFEFRQHLVDDVQEESPGQVSFLETVHCSAWLLWVHGCYACTLKRNDPRGFVPGSLLATSVPSHLMIFIAIFFLNLWLGMEGPSLIITWCDCFLGGDPLCWANFLQSNMKMNFHEIMLSRWLDDFIIPDNDFTEFLIWFK